MYCSKACSDLLFSVSLFMVDIRIHPYQIIICIASYCRVTLFIQKFFHALLHMVIQHKAVDDRHEHFQANRSSGSSHEIRVSQTIPYHITRSSILPSFPRPFFLPFLLLYSLLYRIPYCFSLPLTPFYSIPLVFHHLFPSLLTIPHFSLLYTLFLPPQSHFAVFSLFQSNI